MRSLILDPRMIGNLFYVYCDELQDISLMESLHLILSLLEDQLQEQFHLAQDEIRRMISYLINSLPTFFKERLAVLYCES